MRSWRTCTMRAQTPIKKGWGAQLDIVPEDVLECLEELGVTVTKLTYNEAWALCPGHLSRLGRRNNKPDKWSVNIATGEHSCFSCGFSGSFTRIVQEVLGYDRESAQRWLRAHGGRARFRDDRRVSSRGQRTDE